jgi:diguanylate cyclase (GGDEF)-like protein/PAS domain S-box-containing protein
MPAEISTPPLPARTAPLASEQDRKITGHQVAYQLARVVPFEWMPLHGGLRWQASVEDIYGDLAIAVQAAVSAVVAGLGDIEEPYEGQHVVGGQGREVTLRIEARPRRDPRSRITAWVGAVADITDRREAETELHALVDRYRLLVELSPDGIIVHQDAKLVYINDRALEIMGAPSPEAVLGRNITDFLHPDSLGETLERISALETEGAYTSAIEAIVLGVEGNPIEVEATSVLTTWRGSPAYQVILRDIRERKAVERDRAEAEAKSAYAATHDVLTELPNRRLILSFLDDALAETGEAERLSVIFVDLDRFKLVNDNLGHQIGDLLLQKVAERLSASVGSDDLVGRLAGDEFVVVSRDPRDIDAAREFAGELCRGLSDTRFDVDGSDLAVSASAGIAFVSAGDSDADSLLREADLAMYLAKQRGRQRVEVFDEHLRTEAREAFELREELRRAIDEDGLSVHYQPILAFGDGTYPITGMEALARWDHSVLGSISPGRFVPVAEESGLVIGLGNFVLRRACADLAKLRRTYDWAEHLWVAVNLASRQLLDPDLFDRVNSALEVNGLEPSALHLELTESAMMENVDVVTDTLDRLDEIGIRLAIDDFGTGYSSLAYLKRFPVSEVKIDRSFVMAVEAEGEDAEIVASTIDLAHHLGKRVVAEGIETPGQLEVLRAWGCDYAQGFLFSKAVPADQLDETVERMRLEHSGEFATRTYKKRLPISAERPHRSRAGER